MRRTFSFVGALVISLSPPTMGFSQTTSPLRRTTAIQTSPNVATASEGGKAALGVTMRDVPGAVEIAGVMPNSPAAEAGLRPGDRILAIDGQAVRTSNDLIRIVTARQPQSRVEVAVDRSGLQGTLHATLSDEHDVFRRAALGVTLSRVSHDGVRVLQVVPDSPAAKAGLKMGDRILALNGQHTTGYADVIQMIGTLEPYTEIEILVDRYGLQGTLRATLLGEQQVFRGPPVVRPVPAIPVVPPPLELTPAEINDQRGYGA